MNQQTPLNPLTLDCNGIENSTRKIIYHSLFTSFRKRIAYVLVIAFLAIAPSSISTLLAQSSTCVPPVDNGPTDPWSEECYLNNTCGLQGNPCQANDVSMLGVFIADSVGGPVPACTVGEQVTVLLWGTFSNNTNSSRYAVRTRTEVWINGSFFIELIGCSFDVLLPGETDVALLGTFTYTCGDQVQLVNTWIGWDSNQAQCSNSGGPNFDNVCGEYPPSKCSRNFDTISFLTPNFEYFCGVITSTTTEVCFTDLTIGGVPPYTYLWEFGDNTTSTLQNPCHTYLATTGSYTVTLTVTDADSIQAGAILVVDLDSLNCCDMTVICPPADGGLFSCVDDIPAADTDLVTVTDSCGPVTITFADDTTGTGCMTDTLFVVRSYFISDGSNLDTCIQTFAAVDDVGPVLIGCPADISVECANLVPPQSLDGIDATDNCSGVIFLSLLADVVSDSVCVNQYVITRTYVATDECGNTTTCDQLITVFDDTDPAFSFVPADTSILCDADTVFGVPLVSDNCGGVVALDSVTNFFTTVTCAGGSIVRTWTATDGCGNTTTADQAIFLIDTIDPEFIFEPADTSIACDEVAVFGTPVVTDNCDVSVSVTSSVTTAPTANCAGGTTTIVWTATDNCGNTATANQVITFIDTLGPVFTFIPNDSTIACGETPVYGVPVATDNCDTQVSITADTVTLAGLCGDTSIVTWTATDNCGNTTTADQTIYEVDILAPSILCPPDVTLQCSDATEPNSTVPGTATATDNCDLTPTVGFADVTVASLTCPLGYTITRTWTATDDCGNSTACVQTIEVVDTLAPTLRCPLDITIECTDSIVPDSTGTPTVVDNCDTSPEVSFTDVTLEGNCPQSYLIERTWFTVDTCGNDTSCVQLISVIDGTGPVIVCPADTIVDCTAAVDTSALGVATATDNCGGAVTISYTDATVAGGCEQEYTINRTWLAVDECLNRTTCVQVISVQDTVPPVFNSDLCPTVFEFFTSEGSMCPLEAELSIAIDIFQGNLLPIDSSWTFGGNVIPAFAGCLTDNCADPDSFYILPSGFQISGDSCDVVLNVSFNIADNCGNFIDSAITFTLTIHDDVAPVITCPLDVTIECDASTSPDSTGFATAIDDCIGLLGITFEDSTAAGACPNEMLIFRTWTADDSCGNTSSCTQLIFVEDNTAPVLTCPPGVTIECTDSTLPDSTGFPLVVDNCDLTPEVTFLDATIASLTCPLEYMIIRSWTAVDTCGNISTCVQNIFVDDSTPPDLTCPANVTIECDESTVPDSTGIATAIDNCDLSPEVTFLDATIAGGCPQAYGIIRVWTAVDTCGNISTCTQLISVVDTTAPVILCPADTLVDCGTDVSTETLGFATATDNCDAAVTPTFSDVTIAGTCPQEYTITRTWVATDSCLNVSTCIQTITIQDTLAPVISCPADTVIDCTSITLPGSTGRATALDNCDLSVLPTFDDVTLAGSCPQEYTITRTWTAVDDCLNESTCVQLITVQDTLEPLLICPPDTVIDCTESTLTDNTGIAIASDNCDLLVTPTFVDVTIQGLCPQGYMIERTWTAVDDCLNSSTCVQLISVQDTLDPVLICPADTIIDCTESTATLNLGVAIATDNCDTLVLVNNVDVIVPSTVCPTAYTILRTWTAVDDCLNRTTCLQTIFVQDTTAPVILCPADTIVDCGTDVSIQTLGIASATDNCDATVTPTFSDVTIAGGCPQEYTITRTWVATDSCFNVSSCVQTITVQDTLAPVIVCPADTVINCGTSISTEILGTATATDNCDLALMVTSIDVTIAGECPQEYTIMRTWTALDDCINFSSCVQIITVQDTTPPVIICPLDTLVDCTSGTSTEVLGFATATDNCDLIPLITSMDVTLAGDCPQEYTITRTWTAIDDCQNSSTCVQVITVQDTLAPVLICPLDITIECTDSTVPDSTGIAVATDNCDISPELTFTDVTLAGGCPQEYMITRTWTATDSCGNSSSCDQLIFIEDNTPPVITCPVDITIDCDASILPDSTGFATALDNCDETPEVTYSDVTFSSQTCLQEYFITRLWTATDSCGNSSTCFQSIFVQDTTPPVATFIPPDVTVECDTNIQVILAELPIFEDNCDTLVPALGSIEVVQNPDCPYTNTYIIAWSGVDDCGNSTTVGRTVVVVDTTAPVIVCPDDVTLDCLDDTSSETNGFAEATDNCDPVPLVTSADVTLAGDCPQEYTITRTWTAADACGNSSTCVQILTVVDTMPPTIVCPADLTFECRNQVPAPSTTAVTAFDSCGIATVTFVGDIVTDSTCVNRLNISRVYQAEDECGNTSTCTQIINVFDDTPPAITCPMNVTVQCAAQVPPVNIPSVVTSDNCGGTPTVTHVGDAVTNMTCANRFTLTRTYRSTDACGNSATCAQVITVFDNTPPMLTCPANLTFQCASQVPAPNIALVTVTDNCAGTSTVAHVSDVITNMTCVNRFTLTRTYRATDACGNSATCAQVITVFDNTAPTITCPANITVQCANQVPAPNTALVTTSDNCGGTVNVTHVSDVITNMTCINRFTLTRTYRATDACGNSATCAQVITVFDNTAPTITFIDPLLEDIANGGTLEVQCFGQDPEWMLPVFGPGSVSTMDNCAGNVTVVVTDDLIDEGDCEVDGYINRYRFVWTATDACGNSSTAFIFMELIDTIPPVIQNIPENITVNCDEIPEPPTNIMATDECLCACVIEFEETVPAPGCQNGQVITRTWTAEDDCGNVTVEVQTITLIDEEGPEIVVIFPELEGVENGAVFEYTCNEGGIPEFFDDLSAESVTTVFSCGTAGIVSFDPTITISNNCKFWGYIESRTYTWEAVDQCGNVSTFTIIVRLVDTEGPQFINIPEMTCVDDPALNEVDIIDNCENAKFTYWDTPIPNPCGVGEALRRTYEAWDDCGNYSRDTVILIPNDQSHPTMEFINPELIGIEFGEILVVECKIGDNGQYTPYGPGDVQVMDACMGEIEVTFTERIVESGDCNDGVVAVMELVWMAMDVCGNRSQLLINAHLVDNTSPDLINFEVDVTIDCNDEMPELFALDNCGEVTITTVDSIIPGACEFEYDVLRRITVSDPCGNTTERLQIVRVGDGQGPVIEGVEEEVCDDLSIPEVTAFDPCAGAFVGVTMQEDTLDVPCRDGFVIERIWTAVDACGNVSEVRQLIIVGDLTPPEIHIPSGSVIRLFDFFGPNLLELSNEGIFERLQALNENSVTINDDCDQEITAEFDLDVTISDNCEEDGYYEHRVYTWIATDACGNADSFSFEIDIMDDVPPVLSGTPQDTIVVCEDLPAPPVVTADDYADDVTIEYAEVIIPGDGPGVFVVTRTWTATDPCGNVSQTSQNITWIPETLIACDILLPETVDCNTHGVVIGSDVSGGLGGVTYMWEITGEKCFIQSGQNTPEITIYVGFSEVEISLTVTDAFGCSNVCTATLDCLDPIVADFNAQQDPTVPVVTEGPSVEGSNDMLDILQHFNMWPNPSAANVNISFESMVEHDTRIVLVNYLGQIVYDQEIRAVKGFNSHKMHVAHLPEGSYMVQLKSERAMESKMLVLVRNK